MSINQSKLHSYLKGKAKEYFSPERLQSRSKLDKRQYRIINSTKKINLNRGNDFKIINSERKINISFSPVNKKESIKDTMPYIPDIERQKAESNFINLI